MEENEKWLQWAVELQALAQAGLYYGKEVYDLERYERIRKIAAEMISYKTDLSQEKVKDLFCNEIGYQTPKLATRAALFKDDKILLVQENDGLWSLPGGWCDVNCSVAENTIKEVKEEAGLDSKVLRVISVIDRDKHNKPVYAYKVTIVFVECEIVSGQFEPNSETIASDFFSLDDLPPLALNKNNEEEIQMCFKAHYDNTWECYID